MVAFTVLLVQLPGGFLKSMHESQSLLQYFFFLVLTFQKREGEKKATDLPRLVAALDCPRVIDARPEPCVASLKNFF